MATALQQQLAQIAAKSTHQLDLKVQKSRHSQSLLFEPRDAASQSFDTIFQICVEEGFDELCQIDARFTAFGTNLFADSSKDVDRTQLTAHENAELDNVLESFMVLVQGRLLLKPAIKTVEWLVRRFRLHEYNTESMLLAFLPYHAADMFATVLSLLSAKQLPATFKWLHPYATALQSPPRSAILTAVTTNNSLFSAFNSWVMRATKARHHSAVLLGFWASLLAQAVNAMIDSTASGRDNVRQQREEDLLLRVLPVLQSAFSVRGIPELYLGSCMIVTILVAKARLDDNVLDALMEAVVGAWTDETVDEGMICLATIAEEKDNIGFKTNVTRKVLTIDNPVCRLDAIGQQQQATKLAAGLACGAVKLGCKSNDATHIILAQDIFATSLFDEQYIPIVLREIVKSAGAIQGSGESGTMYESISRLLEGYASDPQTMELLRQIAEESDFDLQNLRLSLPSSSDAQLAIVDPMDVDDASTKTTDQNIRNIMDQTMSNLSRLPAEISSFLDPDLPMVTWEQHANAFRSTVHLGTGEQRLHILIRAREKGEFAASLTFLMRVGIAPTFSPSARTNALQACNTELKTYIKQSDQADLQSLMPYALVALGDSSAKLRKAAAELVNSIHEASNAGSILPIYGSTESRKPASIESSELRKFLSHTILAVLEDCVLDSTCISRALPQILKDGNLGTEFAKQSQMKEFKKSTRAELCAFFATHAVLTPALNVRIWLLKVLSKVGKPALLARKEVLMPFVKDWIQQPRPIVEELCRNSGVQISDIDAAIISSVTYRTVDEVGLLKDLASGKIQTRGEVRNATFDRIRQLFSFLKSDQYGMASLLLELTLEDNEDDAQAGRALETLRMLVLPGNVLAALTEDLPSIDSLQNQSPAAKKQRTGRSDSTRSTEVDPAKLQQAIRRITLVLELVEASTPGEQSQLLRSLFHLLNELHHYKVATGSDLVYLHQTLLGILLSIVDAISKLSTDNPDSNVDQSAIRTDLIVECLRTTKSTQIHNVALLLVSKLASWQPEMVLHSVMPLFTFMSSTVLRQSDDYSAHVADETVTKIVPPLAESLKHRGKIIASGAAELLSSFVAAYEHIPLQRRLPLFELLVSTLGQQEVLYAVLAMLAVRYGDEDKVMDFARDLAMRFEATDVLKSAIKYMDLVSDGLQLKRTLSDTLLNFNEKSEDGVQSSTETLLDALADLLSRDTLRSKISTNLVDDNAAQSQLIRDLYAQLLENAVQLSTLVASNDRLVDSSDAVLRSILGLLPTAEFINSSGQLMQSGSDATRQQVFRSLEIRAHEAKRGNRKAQDIFLGVLPNCDVYIQASQPVKTRNAAIACIHRIAEKFGKANTTAVLQSANSIAGDAALGSSEGQLNVASLSALASIIQVLGEEAVGVLPPVLSKCIDYLEDTLESSSEGAIDHELIEVGCTLLDSVLESLPWMLSGISLDSAIKIVVRSTSTATGYVEAISANEKLQGLLARKVAPPELFASIGRTWQDIVRLGQQAVLQHLSIVHQAVSHHTKAIITRNAQSLFAILLEAFDLRRHFAAADSNAGEDVSQEVFTMVDTIAMDLTLKLNDATFRPFFMRVVDWASTQTSQNDLISRQHRMMSVYSFSLTLFEQLQSLVTSYSSFLLDSGAQVLQDSGLKSNDGPNLLSTVLQTLSSSFRHDQDDFWQAPSHFEAIAGPLVHQLRSSAVLDVGNTSRECFADFASAASSPEHLKSLNSSLMGLMKDSSTSVRLAAVKCERAVTQKLGLEWLTLLPEMLPMISELMEDDDEDVENEVLRWIREIESATGENLEGMLS